MVVIATLVNIPLSNYRAPQPFFHASATYVLHIQLLEMPEPGASSVSPDAAKRLGMSFQ